MTQKLLLKVVKDAAENAAMAGAAVPSVTSVAPPVDVQAVKALPYECSPCRSTLTPTGLCWIRSVRVSHQLPLQAAEDSAKDSQKTLDQAKVGTNPNISASLPHSAALWPDFRGLEHACCTQEVQDEAKQSRDSLLSKVRRSRFGFRHDLYACA
jgi:hypothetical protein